mmetsp:Transcript_20531/g.17927  ORF Transcript_20531/g.17927 Transcript_20531/m.17927 type:complete len:225 (-) Transcript_20531:1211-1885(-)
MGSSFFHSNLHSIVVKSLYQKRQKNSIKKMVISNIFWWERESKFHNYQLPHFADSLTSSLFFSATSYTSSIAALKFLGSLAKTWTKAEVLSSLDWPISISKTLNLTPYSSSLSKMVLIPWVSNKWPLILRVVNEAFFLRLGLFLKFFFFFDSSLTFLIPAIYLNLGVRAPFQVMTALSISGGRFCSSSGFSMSLKAIFSMKGRSFVEKWVLASKASSVGMWSTA